MDLDEARKFWKVASTFPPNKESVYPAHAGAHEFDVQGQPGKRVLEYGCGGGSDTESLLRRGAAVLATDIVPENVQTTRARLAAIDANYRVEVMLLESSASIPAASENFDSVNCHGVLHHIPEAVMHRVIDEFHRVLKPGGHLYAMLYTEQLFERCMPQIEGLRSAHGWPVDRCFSYCTDGGGIARAYSLGGGRELFEQHGFEFVSAVEYNDADFRTFKVRR